MPSKEGQSAAGTTTASGSSTTPAFLAPSSKDTRPRSRDQHRQQQTIQADLQQTKAQLGGQLPNDPEWKKRKQIRCIAAAADGAEVRIEVTENGATSIETKLFDHAMHSSDNNVDNKEDIHCKEATSSQFGIQLFASSFDASDCTPVLSDEDNRGSTSAMMVEKAVPASPSRLSLMDKTFTSSSDESSQDDEETGVMLKDKLSSFIPENGDRRRQAIIAVICCIVCLLALVFAILGGTNKLASSSNIVIAPMPSNVPSISPTMSTSPSTQPTSIPSAFPSAAPFVLMSYGEALYTDTGLGIQVSVGLTVRRIAKSGSSVSFANGNQSSIPYHSMMDGAGISLLPDGGYVYMSNAEVEKGGGGVYGLYFNKEREITDYKALLTGTSRNCGGGMSPWNTWISCEEVDNGQCWQVDPNPDSPYHNSPNATLLGGPNGGAYETVAVDNTDEDKPVFFTTEDKSNGELRRFEADGNGWDALHEGGKTTYLEFLDGNRFQWTSDLDAGMNSAANHYPNAEGIIYHNSTLYFVAKVSRTLFILDLEDMTYTSERTGSSFVGQGSFNSQPDQIIESDLDTRKYVYFTEDGGNKPGIHVRDRDGNYYTMLRGVPDGRYKGDETVGIAFSPDRRAFYFGFQDAGVLMEVTRDDGHAFN